MDFAAGGDFAALNFRGSFRSVRVHVAVDDQIPGSGNCL